MKTIDIVQREELRQMMEDLINICEDKYKHILYELKVYALENIKFTLLKELNKE